VVLAVPDSGFRIWKMNSVFRVPYFEILFGTSLICMYIFQGVQQKFVFNKNYYCIIFNYFLITINDLFCNLLCIFLHDKFFLTILDQSISMYFTSTSVTIVNSHQKEEPSNKFFSKRVHIFPSVLLCTAWQVSWQLSASEHWDQVNIYH
jgi:hypothetical protein